MSDGNALRNEDFRRLLATPSAHSSGATSGAGGHSHDSGHTFTHKQVKNAAPAQQQKKKKFKPPEKKEKTDADELVDESEARLHEILSRYRDRAAERRKDEHGPNDANLKPKFASGVRPFREDESAAERREQEIRESKYLGGDIEHTHLVKGLDYSLLNKARSEMTKETTTKEQTVDIDTAFQDPVSKADLLNKAAKSKMARSICKVLFEDKAPVRNDFFQKGRMAYVVELDEEAQQEIPVTLLRSTFEVGRDRSEQNANANNLLINKLTEVLAYLRSDSKKKKKEVKGTNNQEGKSTATTSSSKPSNRSHDIFEDVGDYEPEKSSKSSSRSDRDREKNDRARDYFDSGRDRDRERRERERDRDSDRRRNGDDRSRDRGRDTGDSRASEKRPAVEHHPFPQSAAALGPPPEEPPKTKKSKMDEDEAYSELFPSNDMFYSGMDDSDDEDFTKMDMGPKKGPVKRWDFESQEDFEKYQSGREALPKAAFQYGVKTNSGRKTRKTNAAAEEKRLDREYEKITKIWDERKKTGGNSSKNY